MPNKNIIYLHGLSSSGNSGTGKSLRKLFTNENVLTPDIPVSPVEALPFLKEFVSKLNPAETILVGTSMGGMYTQQLSGFKRIIVNPAFHVSNTLKKNLGKTLPFHSHREDGATEFLVTEDLVREFEEMEANQFQVCDPENVMALFGLNDDTVNCKEEYLQHYKDFADFNGVHRLTEENLKEIVAPLIKEKLGI